jgi:DNA polymerase epsilon subunit 2
MNIASIAMPSREDSLAPSAHDSVAIPPALRRSIIRTFSKQYGLTLHASAIAFIHDTLSRHGLLESPDDWAEAIQWLAKGLTEDVGKGMGGGSGGAENLAEGSSIVTRAALEKVYQQLLLEDTASRGVHDVGMSDVHTGEAADPERYFHVIDAFRMPKTIFNERRKAFEQSTKKPSLLAPPQAKPAYLMERLQIIKNVVMRNENFLPPLASGTARDRESYMKLTSTANLLGRQGQRFLLFGMLCTSSDGRYALEDADGMVGLDLQDAVPGEGIFTEGSMILVEGEYTVDERIRAFAIGHPPSEPRETAKLMCGGVDFNGTGSVSAHEAKAFRIHEQNHSSLSFVFISELHLDDEKTLRSFGAMLQGYVDADFIPFCFVLCGSFLSTQRTAAADAAFASKSIVERYQDAFLALGDLLVKFPSIVQHSNFVFVPSQDDPYGTTSLPRKSLPKCITDKLVQRLVRGHGGNASIARKLHFVSNPCRLVYFGQEIVIFRNDSMQSLLAHTVRLKGDVEEVHANAQAANGTIDLKKYLVSTILDQAHLCPLPTWARPIMWEFDHTLRLYPMPTALVLADKFQRFELTYEGCQVFNPSSFREGNFCWTTYYPSTGKAERSEMPS